MTQLCPYYYPWINYQWKIEPEAIIGISMGKCNAIVIRILVYYFVLRLQYDIKNAVT